MTRPLKPTELARRKEKRAKARDEKKISEAVEATKKRGGFRPGAGRKPDWLKRASMPPTSARELLLDYETKKLWAPLVTASDLELRFRVLSYLQNCIFGQPKNVSEFTGSVEQKYAHMSDQELDKALRENIQSLAGDLGLQVSSVEGDPASAPVPALPPAPWTPPKDPDYKPPKAMGADDTPPYQPPTEPMPGVIMDTCGKRGHPPYPRGEGFCKLCCADGMRDRSYLGGLLPA